MAGRYTPAMIAHFALRLVCGAALWWALLPRPKITSGFFRVQMLVALGLSVLAALTASSGATAASEGSSGSLLAPGISWIPCAVMAVVAYVGSVLWMLERRAAGTVCGFLVLVLSWGTLIALRTSATELGTVDGWLVVLAETTSAGVVGGSVTAMLLGHWYLTATGMSLDPLHRANTLLGGAVAVRAVVAGIGLALGAHLVQSQTHTLWLVLRWLAGILGPAAGVVMVRRILAYRNTQSATGVLFAAVILVFIGELSATLLGVEVGVPL